MAFNAKRVAREDKVFGAMTSLDDGISRSDAQGIADAMPQLFDHLYATNDTAEAAARGILTASTVR